MRKRILAIIQRLQVNRLLPRALLQSNDSLKDPAEEIADAFMKDPLIAAAPDLLAALESCFCWHGELDPCDEPDDGLRGLLLQMQAAIAKAKSANPT